MTREARLLIVCVIATATLILIRTSTSISWHDWPRLLLLFLLMVLAASVRIANPRGSVTPTTVLTYLTIYVLSPPTALLVVGSGRTLGYAISRGWVPWRAVFNGAQSGLSAAFGAFLFGALGGQTSRVGDPQVYLAALAGPIAFQLVNHLLVALPRSQFRGSRFINEWYGGVRELFWPNLLSVPTAFVLSVFYTSVHHAVILIYLVLLPFHWLALRLYVKRRELYAQIVDGLVVAADANFPLARGHARRVAEIATAIARELRVSETLLETVQFAALLHDIGMIGKDALLDHPVTSDEDGKSLQEHVRVGAEIARELPRREIADAILHHHERDDGGGYPDGLRGEAIPVAARIIALAEVVDSIRMGLPPYGGIPADSVAAYVAAERGRAFNPEIVDAFLRIEARGGGKGPQPPAHPEDASLTVRLANEVEAR
jgi:putative nucleotidyltransferase with HDIG domain